MKKTDLAAKYEKIFDDLWDEVAAIETVYVQIPVDYTPEKYRMVIPHEDNKGVVYSVIAVPKTYLEKAFQRASFALEALK